MLLASSGFITICPKKEVELGADRHLHRAVHAEELKKEIEFDCPKATGNQYAYLPGGGVRAINPNSSMTLAETENLIAVFKGNLFNKAELAINVLGVHTQLGEAQLLLQLYAAKGLDMLGMLNGQFAFCLYDSKQARVLAARDHSGAVPLMEGRTAAGSLIIACGTFLPEGVTCMSDIKPGEYKYGWHALPRAFTRGETRIISGRASCEYGIRRRSIDAYNAPQRRSIDLQRGSSMDIPRKHSGSHMPSPTSHSYSHAPGRYMPPHLAAAAAAGGCTRQRATSFDGHNMNGSSSGSSSHYHAGAPPASGGRRRSETNTPGSKLQPHPAPATQHWAPRSPLAVAAGSPAAAAAAAPSKPAGLPPPIQTPSAGLHADEVTTPGSMASSTPSTASGSVGTPHRRKRRHHRRGRTSPSPNAASTAVAVAAAAADETNDGQASEADSQISSSTHDSANSGPDVAAATAGTAAAAKQQGSGRKGGSKGAAAKGAAGGKPAAQQKTKEPQKQQQQPRRSSSGSGGSSGGVRRNGSCGELAVLGSSPTAAHGHSVLLAAPQGLAC